MAIYHLTVKIIGRSKGKNVVASIAYRRAAKLFCEREQKHFDYRKKPNVIYSEIMAPHDAPQWALDLAGNKHSLPADILNALKTQSHFSNLSQFDFSEIKKLGDHLNSQVLWNKVEASEKRCDSQLAREVEFALPVELDIGQNLNLAREYIQNEFVSRGMIADWSVHWDAGNPHETRWPR